MNNITKKSVIVVLGPGRSGTSILMQILEALAMTISKDMVPPKEHNPFGAYEDIEIFKTQDELRAQISPATMPPPPEWLNSEGVHQIKVKLKTILESRIQDSSTVFGFKDPKTALFIPLWTQIFNELSITPLYILATRRPESVIKSMKNQWQESEAVTELFWLTKNTEALYQTGGNCFIVHYEDWFSERAPEVVKQLLHYTGLETFWDKSKNASDVLTAVIKPNLNRACHNDYAIKNRYVLQLQEQLQQCHGDQFDRQSLMSVVMECRKAMDEFSGWAIEAQRFFRMRGGRTKKNDTQKLKKELEKSILEANRYLHECKNLADINENLRIKISVQAKETTKNNQELKKNRRDLERNNKELFALKTSTSFQVGRILINAVAKPGKNTILFPLYLLRVALASRVGKK